MERGALARSDIVRGTIHGHTGENQMRMMRGFIVAGVVAATVTISTMAASAAARTNPAAGAAAATAVGAYFPLAPNRILDTRGGFNAPAGPLGAGKVIRAQVTGANSSGSEGVPAEGTGTDLPAGSISAAVLNVTVVNASRPSFLTVYPDGSSRPTTSSINFGTSLAEANGITVPLSSDGAVDIFNQYGSVNVIVDVVGYYGANDALISHTGGPGGSYEPTAPSRIYDSRRDPHGALTPDEDVALTVSLSDTSLNAHIRAIAVNVTATSPTSNGFLSVHPGNAAPTGASTLNFAKGQTVANSDVVEVCPAGTALCNSRLPSINVYNASTGRTNVIVDIVGFFDDGTIAGGLRFHAITPIRIADSRSGEGIPHALGPLSSASVDPGSIGTADTVALATNVTAVSPTLATFLTVWPDLTAKPNTSTINPAAHQTVSNGAYVLEGSNGKFDVANQYGTVGVVVDVTGTLDASSGTAATATPLSARSAEPVR
jgi:hypothetical protein